MYDGKVHVLHDPGPFEYFVAGVDWGSKNPSVIRVHGCRFGRKRSHVVAEHYRSGVTSPDFTDICAETARMFNPITFVVDPSAADVRTQMANAGLSVRAGNNDVLAGIRCLEAALTHREAEADRPLLTMEPSCSKGNLEYPAYRWKDGIREQPAKEFDHAIDADRYARMFISAGFGEPAGLIELGRRGRRSHGESPEARRHRLECERLGITHEPPPLDPNDPRLWPDAPRPISPTMGDYPEWMAETFVTATRRPLSP